MSKIFVPIFDENGESIGDAFVDREKLTFNESGCVSGLVMDLNSAKVRDAKTQVEQEKTSPSQLIEKPPA